MPPGTALKFYRKKQTLESLKSERPQSLETFYGIIKKSTSYVEKYLMGLEREFYGPSKTCRDEINLRLPMMKAIMSQAKIHEFNSKEQFEEVLNRTLDPFHSVKYDTELLNQIEDYMTKVIRYTKFEFKHVIDVILEIIDHMDNYCSSFSNASDSGTYLETVSNYQKQRQDLSLAIRLNIQNIGLMIFKFEKSGLFIYQFSLYAEELGESCRCAHVPFLLIFPAACENIRNCCLGIKKWLQADSNYAKFLTNDIIERNTMSRSILDRIKQMQETVAITRSRQKTNEREMKSLSCEWGKISNREKHLTKDEFELKAIQQGLKMEIDKVYFQRLGILKMKDDLHKSELMKERKKREQDLTDRKLDVDKQLIQMRKKLDIIGDLKQRIKQNEMQSIELKSTLSRSLTEIEELQSKEKTLDEELYKLKEIYVLKTSMDTLKKIFHRLPIEGVDFHLRKRKKELDDLEKAFRITSRQIAGDWPILYRHLPLYPARGETTVGEDLRVLSMNFMRCNSEEQALQSLRRWRRTHIRASVEDLKVSLHAMRRRDIVEQLESKESGKAGGDKVDMPLSTKHPGVKTAEVKLN